MLIISAGKLRIKFILFNFVVLILFIVINCRRGCGVGVCGLFNCKLFPLSFLLL